MTDDLKEILQKIWAALETGAANSKDALHTPVLGTVEAGLVSLRTVVLRGVEPEQRTLFCHSDRRSDKIKQLNANPSASWLFYAPERKLQIRAQGTAFVHYNDELAYQHWQQTSLSSRRAYSITVAPGTLLAAPDSGLPAHLIDRSPNLAESESGWSNFAVISSLIQKLDWLWLDAKGHRRVQFEWTGTDFRGSWVIP